MADYLKANQICDLVMKGGITSGVVYPPAIDQIAQRFWLSGIGGASAGAIAAALAAGAEYRRRRGDGTGFELLRRVPNQISDGSHLLSLFKPDAATRDLFNLAILANSSKGALLRRLMRCSGQALKVAMSSPLKKVCDNNFGLCTGMAQGNRSGFDPLPPLTEWLDKQIDEIAGNEANRPLTFGDLWAAPAPPGLESLVSGSRSIQLQMVSTCLTFGRPYALPFLDRRFAFRPDQLCRLFPKRVVDYLVKEGEAIAPDLKTALPAGMLPLPVGGKLPVIVATRMSLSFPALFAMVPLHYTNYHETGAPTQPVWFSDGGLTSNLPIHFFDSPVPRWPTLAINLQYADTKGAYGRATVDENGVWMTESSRGGRLELFHPFGESGSSVSRLFGALKTIFAASQNWHDNSFLVLPGYGDRVAEIWLDPDEGGLNLAMPKTVIDRLLRKGETAGRRLVARFADKPTDASPSWDSHRWARYRSTSAALADYLRAFARGMRQPLPSDPSLLDLLKLSNSLGYPFGTTQAEAEAVRSVCEKSTSDLVAWVDGIDAASETLEIPEGIGRPFIGAPRPSIELAARAPLVPPS